MTNFWLGVDTSNYTTSVAAIDLSGKAYNIKIPLCVKPGDKGVRQSDAVFMHVNNLPIAIDELFSKLRADNSDGYNILSIGASDRPRNVEGSYMPCFLPGLNTAWSLSSALDIPLYRFSHQEGHVSAVLSENSFDISEDFFSFHLSGGTCELLKCKRTEFGFVSQIVSKSLDITLGQLIDRVGVAMGMRFPCGAELEKLAILSNEKYKIKVGGSDGVNLSGFENVANKMILDGRNKCDVARYVFDVVEAAVGKMLETACASSSQVVFAGGVSSSKILRDIAPKYCNPIFASQSLSTDNAVGVARLARDKYLKVQPYEQ